MGRAVIAVSDTEGTGVGHRAGRARVRLAFGVSVGLLVALAAAGCAAKKPTASPSAPPATSAGGQPSASPSVGSEEGTGAAPVLPDGRHPVYLTGLDVAGRKVTFDLIQFLTGEEAKKAWASAHPEEPDGPPNDYFIVNQNTRLRTMQIADPVTVMVVDLEAPGGIANQEIPFTSLLAHLAEQKPGDGDRRLSYNPYWLTIAHDQVTRIEEQFVP